MPHDKNGNLLNEGDEVILRGRVTAISPSETQCNITVEAVERPEGEAYTPTIAGNSKFYELLCLDDMKIRLKWAQQLFDGAAEALGLPQEFRLLTCWEELLGKIQQLAEGKLTIKSQIEPSNHVAVSKGYRQLLDGVLQSLKSAQRKSRERSIAITKIQEAIMWIGMDLKAINEESPGAAPNPYPQSYNPASPVIEPTADGLKL